ncbi:MULTISPECIES: phage tail protein [Pseudomonas fluorescens group]
MTDQNSQFFAILTAIGKAKQANADALGVPWTFAQMGVGDANGTDPIPSEQQTRLINERRRAPLNQLKVDPANPNIIIAEQVIPENVGGWWIREVSLYDTDGDMVAVANCAPSFKPLLTQGSGRTQVVRMNLIVSNTANVELKIDPSVVLATRQYVDMKILEELNKQDFKNSVLVATTTAIVLAGAQTIDGVAVPIGARVLVKNQAAAKDNGIYIVAAGAWPRSADADSSADVTSGLTVSVESGVAQADTVWQLMTDGPIVLGTTALNFQDITNGFARLLSPTFTGMPKAPTPAQFDSSKLLATTEFVKRSGLEYSSFSSISTSVALTAAHVGGLHSFSSAAQLTVTLPPSAGVAQGATVTLSCAGAGGLNVIGAGNDVVYTSTGVVGALAMTLGDTAEFIRLQDQWRLIGGTLALRFAGVMTGEFYTTRPQHDNTKALATTEFVQRGMGNYRGFINATGALALTAASIGSVVTCIGTFTVTLPSAGDSRSGSTVHFRNIGSGTITVACAGADAVNAGSGQVTSIVLAPGTNLELIGNGVSSWWASGSAQLGYSDIFSGQYSPAGFQKGPNGFIEQWMQATLSAAGTGTITYPQTLSAVYGVHPVVIFGGTYYGVSLDGPPGLSSCGLRASAAAPLGVFVRIIGKR